MVKELSPRQLLNVCPREGRYATGKLAKLSAFIAGLLPDLPFAGNEPHQTHSLASGLATAAD